MLLTGCMGLATAGALTLGILTVAYEPPVELVVPTFTIGAPTADHTETVQAFTVASTATTAPLTRSSYSASSMDEVHGIQLARLAETRAGDERVASATGMASAPMPALHDPLDGTVTFPLDGWGYNFAINAWRTAERPNHNGVDLMVDTGTPIYAVADGEVIFSGPSGAYGNVVFLSSVIGGVRVETRYAHQVEQPPVKRGQQVKAGELIGHVGMTGRANAPHLHFEVLQNGVYVDPAAWLAANAA